ncbi:hypothetical protein [Bradyrhizobium elkanii]|uniref:Uncharacterized protein n=1 Tax=Bradyrhizobium elkanii TaxID=29448 RepID=A0ABV4F051_BRAEL|nr:hypothetical protein [Bradyrhizobium elkanii]MCP1757801.1 hypothetical protein [Bradyrhizobium elkanii]MCS3881902.1 hypothetical protein [Bradyrhizobium elkanii]MCS4218662.1 hypothetical protein [Bradyrhizobium elkanii]MCW2110039.1 hypothetical protein [Bradyrhizobium elkanii]MCW2201589.1 hypothetical protein [Bradyrhizobium elkanii]
MKKRCAITMTFSVDLDMVKGWGDKPSDWTDLIRAAVITSNIYQPEMVVHEIIEKKYDYVEGTGYVRPTIVTAADRDVIFRGGLHRIIAALIAMEDSDEELGHPDEARLTRELIAQLRGLDTQPAAAEEKQAS